MSTNWDRWHWLLDKKALGPLSAYEATEFERMRVVADKLDATAADLARPSMDRLVKRHEGVLASMRRAIRALEGLKP